MQDTFGGVDLNQDIPDFDGSARVPRNSTSQIPLVSNDTPSRVSETSAFSTAPRRTGNMPSVPMPVVQESSSRNQSPQTEGTGPVPSLTPTPLDTARTMQQQQRGTAPQQRMGASSRQNGAGGQAQVPSSRPRAASGTPVIVFDNLTKTYSEQATHPALENLSLAIYPGEFVFLVGHSGSGKSTFIRLLNRELTPTAGRLLVAGEDLMVIRKWRVPYLRRNIGCVFQDFKLLPNKTAFENVAFALEVIGKSKHVVKTQVPEVLRLVGLEDKMDHRPDELSGGEQQRVSIARAIVNRPPLLICDEPTGNLDPQTSLGIMRLLDRINRTGTTILVATHDREMVDSMRRRVVALEEGHLVRDESRGAYGKNA